MPKHKVNQLFKKSLYAATVYKKNNDCFVMHNKCFQIVQWYSKEQTLTF